MINLFLALVGLFVKFVWVLNSKADELHRTGVRFSFKKYLQMRWMRWVTHLVSSVGLSLFTNDIVKYIHEKGGSDLSSFEAPVVAFLIGMFGYDLIRIIVKTKEKILPNHADRNKG